MIAYVFKRRGARTYSGRYRLDGEKKINQAELGCSSRQVAEKKFGRIVEEKEREAAGIIAPKDQRDAARTPLVEHLDEMIASKARGNDGHYLRNMKGRITRLTSECGWKYAKDVSPETFQTWVTKQDLSAKALNEYLISARTLFNWMEKRGRILANPLQVGRSAPNGGRGQEPKIAFSRGERKQAVRNTVTKRFARLGTVRGHRCLVRSAGCVSGWGSGHHTDSERRLVHESRE